VAEDLLELSSRIIDTGRADVPVNRVTQELSELGDGVAVVESFSHCVAVDTGDGLVCFDASGAHTGAAVVEALRGWRTDPVATLVYTHGHVDHVGGSGAFAADAQRRGHGPPQVVAHRAVQDRFDRYRRTDGWNQAINRRQFGGISPARASASGPPRGSCPTTWSSRPRWSASATGSWSATSPSSSATPGGRPTTTSGRGCRTGAPSARVTS
jgi:hypothetical protein